MKWLRFLILGLVVSLFLPQISLAGDDGVITLNDDTPGLTILVNSPPHTTGVVYLEIRGASVEVTDGAGATIFQLADERVYAVELRFAPTDQQHTITVERLADFPTAYVTVHPHSRLRDFGAADPITGNNILMLQQATTLELTDDVPGTHFALVSPANTVVALSVEFARKQLTSQVIDNSGVAMATVYDGGIDGFSLVMLGGDYSLSLLKSAWGETIAASVKLAYAQGYILPAATTP